MRAEEVLKKTLPRQREWYRESAEQGYARAQSHLGYCYGCGWGVTQDLAKAAEWYRKSAEQGDAIAQSNLGILYENGRGVTKDLCQGS